jgi:hypothetical protein
MKDLRVFYFNHTEQTMVPNMHFYQLQVILPSSSSQLYTTAFLFHYQRAYFSPSALFYRRRGITSVSLQVETRYPLEMAVHSTQ